MIISTWNLRHGGGKKINEIIRVLSENTETDVFVLTEYRNNANGKLLKSELYKFGYIYQYNTDSNPKLNSVLIAYKIEFNYKTFNELNEHKQRVIKVFNEKISIYGCYFPLKKLKKEVFEFLINQIDKYNTEKIVIVGDFNTGKHFVDEKEKTFYCSEYFNKLNEKEMFDAWRVINGNKSEYSWFIPNTNIH